MSAGHVPVFFDEVLEQAREVEADLGRPLRRICDGTFGRGGHLRGLLTAHPQARAVAFDQDADAIRFGKQTFAAEISNGRLRLVHSNFEEVASTGLEGAAGYDFMLFDLGVSSPQLDTGERGFSFYHDGPLDMRMDTRAKLTAETIVNEWSENDLVAVFQDDGEVERPHKVARAIVSDRKVKRFTTTKDLAGLIERVDGWAKKGHHPATLYFMALRLRVNRELEVLERVLPLAFEKLEPGGRVAIITFHSLEDRIVKNFFRSVEDSGELGANFGESVRRKATKPAENEVDRNSRSRSAKLRVFRRYAAGETRAPKNKYAHLIGKGRE